MTPEKEQFLREHLRILDGMRASWQSEYFAGSYHKSVEMKNDYDKQKDVVIDILKEALDLKP